MEDIGVAFPFTVLSFIEFKKQIREIDAPDGGIEFIFKAPVALYDENDEFTQVKMFGARMIMSFCQLKSSSCVNIENLMKKKMYEDYLSLAAWHDTGGIK